MEHIRWLRAGSDLGTREVTIKEIAQSGDDVTRARAKPLPRLL
jgi:hypothetical protein